MTEPTQFSGRPSAPGGRSTVIVVCVVVAFIALAIAKPWDAPPPSSTASPLALDSPVPTPSASSPTPADTPSPFPGITSFTLNPPPPQDATWTAIRWQAIDLGNSLAHLGSSIRWAGGYASIGDDGEGSPQLWTSPNAMAWSPVGHGSATTFWPGMRVEAVAPFGRQLLAVTSLPTGSASTDPATSESVELATWLSDDGAAWQLHGGPIFPNPTRLVGGVLAAGAGDRTVIAWNEAPEGERDAPPSGHLAVTGDGASWQAVPASALPAGFGVTDIVAAPGGGFLVAGRTFVGGSARAAILRSDASGLTWRPAVLPLEKKLAPGEVANVVWRFAAGREGILAIGDSPSREVWWWSADGRSWAEMPGFDPVGLSGCPGSGPGCGSYPAGYVLGNGERLIAVGSEHGLWSSFDGRTWQLLGTMSPAAQLPASRTALLPGGVLLVDASGAWWGEASAGS